MFSKDQFQSFIYSSMNSFTHKFPQTLMGGMKRHLHQCLLLCGEACYRRGKGSWRHRGDWRAGATGAGGWASPSDLDLTGPLGEAVATFGHSQCQIALRSGSCWPHFPMAGPKGMAIWVLHSHTQFPAHPLSHPRKCVGKQDLKMIFLYGNH